MSDNHSGRTTATDNYRTECHELLLALKETVEGLLSLSSANVWNMHGGLERLAKSIKHILKHRLKATQGSRGHHSDIWAFVRGLRWVRPSVASTIGQLEREFAAAPAQRARQWLRRCLLAHDLSSQLGALVNSRQHLLQHYHAESYLCQPDYFTALMICLRAVEQNRPALLADVNPAVLCRGLVPVNRRLMHVRSISLPMVVPPPGIPSGISSCGQDVSRQETDPSNLSRKSTPSQDLFRQLHDDQSTSLTSLTSYGLYNTSCNTSMSDISALASGGIERLGDPLQNFYATSTTEQQSDGRWLDTVATPSTSLETLSEIVSPPPSTLLESFPSGVSPISATLRSNPVRQETRSKRSAIFVTGTDDFVDGVRSDDRLSLRADSGIESNAASNAAVSAASDVSRKASNEALDILRTSENIVKPSKRPTHVRSSSDYGVGRKEKTNVSGRQAYLDKPSLSSDSATDSEFRTSSLRRGFFQQPSEGQSLLSFLSSQDFHTCTDLDKENAHFSIAEALIAAIEQMKWNQTIVPRNDAEHEVCDSDEEIQQLKQRIRVRRTECLKEKARKFPGFCEDAAINVSNTDSTQSDVSLLSFESLSPGECSDSSNEEKIRDAEINLNDNVAAGRQLVAMREGGLSLSMASLYSDADLARSVASQENASVAHSLPLTESIAHSAPANMSADSIAISLLKRFAENQLPKASELVWLVSADDAPQELLPLPASYPISPDDGEELVTAAKQNRLRGNLDWAPPRAQIIFTVHPKLTRNDVLAKQNYRCAGCGSKVEMGYVKRYRYCEYLGKYFCPCCHSDDRAYIPGRILRKWDFGKYSVSHFSLDLLRRIYRDPLFTVEDTASKSGGGSLYRKAKSLELVRECRIQLFHLSVFINTCTRPNTELLRLKETLSRCPSHWFTDMNNVHIYSLDELVQVKKNELLPKLKSLVARCRDHISQCVLCQGKGFICEMCRKHDDVIFPFDLDRVATCQVCNACYHKLCFDPVKCPRCMRIHARRMLMEAADEPDETSPDANTGS